MQLNGVMDENCIVRIPFLSFFSLFFPLIVHFKWLIEFGICCISFFVSLFFFFWLFLIKFMKKKPKLPQLYSRLKNAKFHSLHLNFFINDELIRKFGQNFKFDTFSL